MPKKEQTQYQEAVHRALERCQFVEESLRIYLDLVIQIAKIELVSHFPVNLTKKNLSTLPLGRLTEAFLQFNGTTSLKSELKALGKKRNHVAHQSLLFTLGEWEDPIYLEQITKEMIEIEQSAKAVQEAILEERWKLHKSINALRRRVALVIAPASEHETVKALYLY